MQKKNSFSFINSLLNVVVSGVLILLWLWVVHSCVESRWLRNLLVAVDNTAVSHIINNLGRSTSVLLLVSCERRGLLWWVARVIDPFHNRSQWCVREGWKTSLRRNETDLLVGQRGEHE